ncbi:MAG: hypothetical protein ACLFPF_10930, partial [Halanaerobiales bacterium]
MGKISLKYIKSIKAKMAIIFGILVVIIIVGISFFVDIKSRGILEKTIFIAAQEDAVHSAEQIDEWLNKQISTMEIMTQSEDVQSGNWSKQEDFLRQYAGETKDIKGLFVANLNGRYRITHGEDGNISDRNYFQQVLDTGKPAISEVLISKASNEYIVVIAHPI